MPNYVIERELPAAGRTAEPVLTWVQRLSESRAMSPKTRSTVSTSRPMERWCENTPNRAAFRQTAFRK
jgi:hypothetical protein